MELGMIEYKRLTAEDTAIAKKLVKTFRNQNPSDEKVLLALKDPYIYLYVAMLEDDICGYVKAYRLKRFDEENDFFMVYHCFVLEKYQRMHIASTLMSIILDEAKAANAYYTFLITQSDNAPAKRLYEGLGGYDHPKNKEVFYWYPEGNSAHS
jgi:ribosomal protein S18 acetylase RimI-like enzyme